MSFSAKTMGFSMTPSVLAGGVPIRDGAEAISRDGSGVLPYREYSLVLLFEWGAFNDIMDSLVDIIAVTTGSTRVSDAT